jgi:hypothetical protein
VKITDAQKARFEIPKNLPGLDILYNDVEEPAE